MSGRISSPDAEIVFRTAESLVEDGDWSISPIKRWTAFGTTRGRDGRFYSLFGPAEAVAMVPFFLLGRWCEAQAPSFFAFLTRRPFFRDYYVASRFNDTVRLFAAWLNVLVTAFSCLVLYQMARALAYSAQTGLLLALLFGLATPAWAYTRDGFSEPLATLLGLVSFERLLVWRSHPRQTDALIVAGLTLGLSVLTHISMLLSVPFFVGYVLMASWIAKAPSSDQTRKELRQTVSTLTLFLLPLGLCGSLLIWHNCQRFGSWFETGRMGRYGHFVLPWEGLLGLTVSPGKGLLLYAPVVIAGICGFPSFHRRHRLEARLIASMSLFRLLFVAARSDWHGGFCIGPRLLLVLLPFLLLPAAPLLDELLSQPSRHGKLKKVSLCIGISFFIQIILVKGNIFDYLFWRHVELSRQGIPDAVIYNHLFHWSWSCSPLVGFLWFPPTDLLLLDAVRYGAPMAFLLCFVAAFVVLVTCLIILRGILVAAKRIA